MAIKLRDAGTTDRFGLAFQHQIKKKWTKRIANYKYYLKKSKTEMTASIQENKSKHTRC